MSTLPMRPDEIDGLGAARAEGLLTALDVQFARRLADLYGCEEATVRWALAIACHQQAAGHVCADLERLASEGIATEVAGETRVHPVLRTADSVAAWVEALEASALVMRPGEESKTAPLVLDERNRLFLAREHRAEVVLAQALLDRAQAADLAAVDEAESSDDRAEAFDADPATRAAVALTRRRPLSIVTGGPGTGKTTLVVRLVVALTEAALAAGAPPPRVLLLAPTGKAAAALAQAFARGRDRLALSEPVRAALPDHASTLQRALFGQTRQDALGRAQAVRLDADVVVVDEVSMVDQSLLSRFFEASADVERVLLLGDPDQLASVDAGAVLGDLVAVAEGDPDSKIARSGVRLTKSHRFDADRGIGQLAEAIREGDVDRVLGLLDDPAYPELARHDAGQVDRVTASVLAQSDALVKAVGEAGDPREKLARLAGYRVLCAHRRGPLGVETLGARLDESAARVRATTPTAGWWRGRMVLVTRNAPEQDLWNGDVGLVDETESGLRALFGDGAGGVRALTASRLPPHESALAMSVHKSQGSEFSAVDLVLGERLSPLMTRELLYTGVTRARESLRIFASADAIRGMIGRRVARDSGLRERLEAGRR